MWVMLIFLQADVVQELPRHFQSAELTLAPNIRAVDLRGRIFKVEQGNTVRDVVVELADVAKLIRKGKKEYFCTNIPPQNTFMVGQHVQR